MNKNVAEQVAQYLFGAFPTNQLPENFDEPHCQSPFGTIGDKTSDHNLLHKMGYAVCAKHGEYDKKLGHCPACASNTVNLNESNQTNQMPQDLDPNYQQNIH